MSEALRVLAILVVTAWGTRVAVAEIVAGHLGLTPTLAAALIIVPVVQWAAAVGVRRVFGVRLW